MIAARAKESCGNIEHFRPPNEGEWIVKQRSRRRTVRHQRHRAVRGLSRPRLVFEGSSKNDQRQDPQYDQIIFHTKLRLRSRFEMIADLWERETRNMSSPNAAERHPLYAEIIKMGKPAIPWILRRLAEFPSYWFKALSDISQEKNDPVKPWMMGQVQEMADAWLRWGVENGYIRPTENRNT